MRRIVRKEVLHCGCIRYVYDVTTDVLCCSFHKSLLCAGSMPIDEILYDLYNQPAYVAPPRRWRRETIAPIAVISSVALLFFLFLYMTRKIDRSLIIVPDHPHVEASWNATTESTIPHRSYDVRDPFGLRYDSSKSWGAVSTSGD